MAVSTLVAVGVGISAFGQVKQVQAAKQASQLQQQQIAQEQQAEAVRRQSMELDARRRTLENLRNAQKARATGLAAATNQGAQFGSGLQGGFGQVSGEVNTLNLGIGQNLEAGEQLFDINNVISQDKIGIANAQGQAAVGQGLSAFGGTLLSSATTIKAIGSSAFGSFGKTPTTFGTDVFNRSGAI